VSVIYVTQEQRGKNISPALKYGDKIVSCLPQDHQLYSSRPETGDMIRKALHHIAPEDYVLLIGDPIIIGMTMAIASEFLNGTVEVLKWDAQTRTYVPVTVEIW